MQISVQVRELMDNVSYWLDNKTFEPREAAVRFHHKLVYIHPFPNGNGRHARYMADAVMEKIFHLPPINWGSTEALHSTSEVREQYINALREADRGVYDDLLKFTSS